MKTTAVWIVLLVLVSGFANQAAGQQPRLKQMMDSARQMAAEGKETIFVLRPIHAEVEEGGVYVFYNNPEPFCYTYMIPGNWVGDPNTPGMYRATDGKASAGVLFFLAKQLGDYPGQSLVERARAMVTHEYEKVLGQKLSGAEFVPFESARSGTWEWKAPSMKQGDRYLLEFPTKVIVDLSPDAIVQITVAGPEDGESLARRIIESLKTTSEPECYWTALETMLRSIGSPVSEGEKLYTNPRHKWSVSYPDTWTLDDSNVNLVVIKPPSDVGMCGVHSASARFTTVGEFADLTLRFTRDIFEARGLKQEVTSRRERALADDVPVVDVAVDIVPGGRGRRVFVLWRGRGILIDCESHVKNWSSLENQYDQIISSFTLPRKVKKEAEKECRPPTYRDIRDGYKCAR